MVARTTPGRFIVTFSRDGQQVDQQVARDSERALKMGMLMLAALEELQDGDTLRCVEESL